MCLSDLGTAVFIGRQGVDQQSCKDSFWKLESGGNFRAIKANGGQWNSRTTHADGRGYLGVCAKGGNSKGVTPPSMVTRLS